MWMIKYTDDEVNHSPGSGRVTFSQNCEIGQYIKNTLIKIAGQL